MDSVGVCSHIGSVVLSELGSHGHVILHNFLDIAANAVDCLLCVVIGFIQAVFKSKVSCVSLGNKHFIELSEDLGPFLFFAKHYLFVVGERVGEVFLGVAVLGCVGEEGCLHLLEHAAVFIVEIV